MDKMTPDQIKAALKAGIISEDQAKNMMAAYKQNAEPSQQAALIGNEEDLRFIRGFSDIFVAIGLVILIIGIAIMAGLMDTTPGFGIAALISYGLAEFFGRKKRAHLPTLVITLAFWGFVQTAIFGTFDLIGNELFIIPAIINLAIIYAYYRRIKFPFCVAILTLSTLFLIWSLISPLINTPKAAGPVLFISGLIVLALGIYNDSKDVDRLTRFSDNAFWLHLVAAPMLIHGAVFSFIIQSTELFSFNNIASFGPISATGILIIVGIMALIGLVLNRRALIVSSLFYALGSIGYLLSKLGLDWAMTLTITLLLIGLSIIILGVAWHPIRNAIIPFLPQNRFIPPAFHGR